PPDAVARLWHDYRSQVEIEPPSFRTDNTYRLTSLGWVGFIPVTPTFGLLLQPRVPLRSLFGMLATVHSFQSVRFLDGLFEAESLPEFYEQIALVLARRVLKRCRQGIYRAYVARSEA